MERYDRVKATVAGLGAWNQPEHKPTFDLHLEEGEHGQLLSPLPDQGDGRWWLVCFRAPAGTEAAVYSICSEDTLEVIE